MHATTPSLHHLAPSLPLRSATCRKGVVDKVLRLLSRRERWLAVSAVRFVRTCVGTKDDFYVRHFVRTDVLKPIMTAFFANGPRYNLLNSAVLELVEFIRKENIKVPAELTDCTH
jgi:protein phosphatase 4 regulatory subunit 3